MAFKTFSSTTLSSSDVNTYLTNSGLVYVASATVSGTPYSLLVPDCFNSSFDNYRVVFDQITFSAGGFNYLFQVGGNNTLYYGVSNYDSSGAGSGRVVSNNNSALYAGVQDTASTGGNFDVTNPFLAKSTIISGLSMGANYGTWTVGQHANAVSCTSFTLVAGSGTLTGGSIYVYGYRRS